MNGKIKKRELIKENDYLQRQAGRFKKKYKVTYGFLKARQEGTKLSELIERVSKKKIETIAIYGTGEIGEYLLKELLEEKQFTILYCLDKKQGGKIYDVPVFRPSAELEIPDIVLITPIGVLKEIEDVLYDKMHIWNTLSVEELFGA